MLFSHVWFYPRSLIHPASWFWLPWKCWAWALYGGVGIKLDQQFLGHPHKFGATLFQCILMARHVMGHRFCGCIGVPVPPLGDLTGYRRWLIQALYLSSVPCFPPDPACSHPHLSPVNPQNLFYFPFPGRFIFHPRPLLFNFSGSVDCSVVTLYLRANIHL